jgi:hypothetical protein
VSSISLIASALRLVARNIGVAAIAAALMHAIPAHAFNTGDITVEAVQGEAQLRQQGRQQRLRKGAIVLVPATVTTGHDGSADLKQGTTLVSVGPDTVLDFPAPERDVSFDRIVQSQGNAFYDVGKRESRKLRVETPYLVAVIKGTQFSVSVQNDSTSISLVEGSLEILSADGGATVNLEAGELAMRRRGEAGITVVDIETARVVTPAPGDLAARVGNDRGGDAAVVAVGVDTAQSGTVVAGNADARVGTDSVNVAAGVDAAVRPGEAELDVVASAGLGPNLPVSVSALVDLGNTGLAVDTGANLGVGDQVAVDAGASLDMGAAGATVDVGSSVDVGDVASVDLDAGVDLGAGGATVDVGAGLDVGDVASVDVDTGVDLGAGGATVDLGAGADVGDVTSVDLDTGIDVGTGGTVVDVGAGVDVGGVTADAGVGADLGAGTVDVGLDLGQVELDVGLDLGLDDPDTTADTGTDDTGGVVEDVVEDVGGLLGGLLGGGRRP